MSGGNVRKVTVYLAPRDYERLAQLVRNGNFTNVDDAIRTAVRRFLAKKEGNGELEGVE